MTPPQLPLLSLVRARIESLLDDVRSGRKLSTAHRRDGEPAVFLASATAIIALAVVLVRGVAVIIPDVEHIAAPKVSMQAWAPATPTPVPTKAPAAIVPAPPPLPP